MNIKKLTALTLMTLGAISTSALALETPIEELVEGGHQGYVPLYHSVSVNEDGVLTSYAEYGCTAPNDIDVTIDENNVLTVYIKEAATRVVPRGGMRSRIGGQNRPQSCSKQIEEFSIDLRGKLRDDFKQPFHRQIKIGNPIKIGTIY
ncbi:hypothetical protein VHTUMSATKI_44180 [Vibrio harveyi]|uniref:hypothetical protein n=1 Tax=Vibrio harveyi TaxID=669 RepID=UPI0036F1E265